MTRFREEVTAQRVPVPSVHLRPASVAPRQAEPPPPYSPRANGLSALPLALVFGSDELSALAPGIAALAPAPFVTLHPEDAARAGLGERARLGSIELAVRLQPDLPRGLAGLPIGLPGMPYVEPGAAVHLEPA